MSEDKYTQDDTNPEGSAKQEPSENINKPDDTPDNISEAKDEDLDNISEPKVEDLDNISETKVEDLDNISEIEEVTATPEKIEGSDEKQIDDVPVTTGNKSKFNRYKIIRIISIIGFIIFTALFINEVVIQPIRIKNSIDLTRDLYNKPTETPATPVLTKAPEPTTVIPATPTPDPNRDAQGRLLQFKDLLNTSNDVKGWLTIPDTNIDYVVTQGSKDNPDYYLDKDINGKYSKAGTLYLDIRSSVEDNTKNYVIYGHNMVSTVEKMFHFLLNYKKVSYYQQHPLITFDTIYNTGEWKIFAVFITNGSDKKETLYDYRTSTFKGSSEFLNFVYQMRIRSILNIDTVDINENDQILTLSTCSNYELDNYRTVIVARKVREGEDTTVDVDSVTKNENPLYPESYYRHYGGKAPVLADTFEEALTNGDIKWYKEVK